MLRITPAKQKVYGMAYKSTFKRFLLPVLSGT